MTEPILKPAQLPRLYFRLAAAASVLTLGLIVLGGVVRITGSGMGCGEHWPRCNGEWFPPLDLPTMIEIGHRWAAALVSLFVLGLALVAWVNHRTEPRLRNPATLALGLLILQVLLGPVIVKLALPPEVIIVHLANAMILLATLLIATMRSWAHSWQMAPSGSQPSQEDSPELLANRRTGRPAIIGAAAFGFLVILLGALVANYHAGLLCGGFPLCNGQLLPPPTWFATVHWMHRVAAFSFLGYMIWLVIRTRSRVRFARSTHRLAILALLLGLGQIGVAASMVLNLLPPALRALHLLVGASIWATLVALVWTHANAPLIVTSPDRMDNKDSNAARRPSLWADLVTLTKPRIISLLLVTTVAPMFITGNGLPSASLVAWVILGGYLMAGGANAINMWFDGDIDNKMSRTKLRPIPSGRLSPIFVLAFGCTLGTAAFAIFYHFANPLSAWLALGGLLFYVLVYTIWLKRSSPQNIVIGGAAGAFPPLVGWTAVTGHLDLTALYLFAIIFYWTPPHFWALALIKQGEYARAGVPMMPVVRGERSTKIQMLGYTIMLVPLTLLPWVSGSLGSFYGVAAILLGGRLLWYCFRLLKEHTVTPTAWGMYKYSLLYLFLLFAAMGFDRVVPTPSPFHRDEVIVLKPRPVAETPVPHLHSD
jgi:heme o synthase